jgi:NAD-dependent dihydropyrimidine dehydrogenase PreA subunit
VRGAFSVAPRVGVWRETETQEKLPCDPCKQASVCVRVCDVTVVKWISDNEQVAAALFVNARRDRLAKAQKIPLQTDPSSS